MAALQGLTRWAFDELGMHRLEILHAVGNLASCRVALGAGYVHEGTLSRVLLHTDAGTTSTCTRPWPITGRRWVDVASGPGPPPAHWLHDDVRQLAMYEQTQRQMDRHVVVCNTRATAELLTTTLAAYGIHASHHAYSLAYPSVDWAQGYRVTVSAADEDEARAVLAALSAKDDVAVLPEDE